jgi:hypothetical protein
MESSFDFLMQLRIDTDEAIREYVSILDRFRREASKGFSIEGEIDMDSGEAVSTIQNLLTRMAELAQQIQKTEAEASALNKTMLSTIEGVSRRVPSMANDISTAFTKGTDAALQQVSKLDDRVERMQEKLSARKVSPGNVVTPEQQKDLDAYFAKLVKIREAQAEMAAEAERTGVRQEKVFEGLEKKALQLETSISRITGVAANENAGRKRFEVQLSEGQTVSGYTGESSSAAHRSRRQDLIDRLTRERDALAFAVPKERTSAAQVDAEGRAVALRGEMDKLIGSIDSLVRQMQAHALKTGTKMPEVPGLAGVSGILGQVGGSADAESLLKSIEGVLSGKVFTVNIAADTEYLLNSLRTILSENGLSLNIGGVADGADRARRIAEKEDENKRTRAEERISLKEKDNARLIGRSADKFSEVLDRPDIASALPPDFRQNLDAIVGAYRPGTPEEMAARTKTGLTALDPVARQFEAFQSSNASETAKELMLRFERGFNTQYATGLRNKDKDVRDRGPSRNPKGMLAGVDYAGEGLYQDQWKRRTESILTQGRGVNARLGGFESQADPWKDATKALAEYDRALAKYERRAADLANVSSVADEPEKMKRYLAAQRQLQDSERFMATSMLDKGQVRIAGQDFSKAEGYMFTRRVLQDNLGAGLDKMNAGRDPQNQLNMNQLRKGLFGGDMAISKEYLRVQGATDEILKDDKLITAEINKQIGSLREVEQVHKRIEKEIADQIKLIDRARRSGGIAGMHGRALRMDEMITRTGATGSRAESRLRYADVGYAHDTALRMDRGRNGITSRMHERALRDDEFLRRTGATGARAQSRMMYANPDMAHALALRMDSRRSGSTEMRRMMSEARMMDDVRNYGMYGGTGRYTRTRVVDPRMAEEQAYFMKPPKPPKVPGGATAGFSGGFGNTIRNAAALFGGVGIGYTAVNQIRQQMRTFMDFQQEIANIQGVLQSKSAFDAGMVSQGVAQVSSKYGVNLLETARAAKVLAQSGLEANDVIRELNTTMAAVRGMGMTIEQVQELQVAVRAVTMENEAFNKSLDYTAIVLDKVSAVESRYAVSSQDLAAAIQLLSPVMAEFGNNMTTLTDSFDYTIALTTVMVERLRITGTQAANILKLTFSRLSRPQVSSVLQKKFGLEIGDSETGDILPLDRLVQELGEKYAELGEGPNGGIRQKQFAVALSGGRNIVGVTAVLQEYARVAQIAKEASLGFGDTQRRAAIGMDTMKTAAERMRTNFSLFIKDAMESTHAADGLRASMSGLSTVFASFSSAGSVGGGLGLVGTVLAGGAAFAGLKKLFTLMATAAKPGGAASALGARMGILARVFTPGGILIAGLLTAISLIGRVTAAKRKAAEEAEKYAVTLRDLSDPEFQNAPQYVNFATRVEELKLGDFRPARDLSMSYLTGDNKGVFEANEGILGKDVSEILAMSDKDFQKWAVGNSKKLREFTRAVTKDVISTLPDETKKVFEAMETESQRVAGVVDLLGNAAWSAAYQMRAAIADLQGSVQRMADETLAGIKKIDDAKKGLFSRGPGPNDPMLFRMRGTLGAAQNLERGTGNLDQSRGVIRRALVSSFEETFKDLPLLKTLLGNTKIRSALEGLITDERIAEGLASPDAAVSAQTLRRELFSAISASPELLAQASKTLAYRDGVPLEALGDVFLAQNATGADPEAVERKAIDNIIRIARIQMEEFVRAATPEAAEAQRRADMFTATGQGTSGPLPVDQEYRRGVMAKFEDALFDLTISLYEAGLKIERDMEWSSRTNTSFNRNDALVSLGRTAFDSQTTTQNSVIIELAKLAKQRDALSSLIVETDRETPRTKAEEQKIDSYMALLRKQLNDLDTVQIADVLGKSPEGKQIAADFERVRETIAGGLGIVPSLGELLELLSRIGVAAALNKYRWEQQRADIAIMTDQVGQLGELEKARLPITALNIRQLQIAQRVAAQQYELAKADLEIRAQIEGMTPQQLADERQRLWVAFEFNRAMAARMEVAKEQRALDTQIRANLDGMLAGVRSSLTDLSIWEAIVDPEGDTSLERARNKAAAIRDVIFNTLNPIFKTITDRFVNNAMDAVADSISEMASVGKMLGSPEGALKANLQVAQMNYEWVISSGTVVGGLWYQQITTAGGLVASQIATAMGNPMSFGGGATKFGGMYIPNSISGVQAPSTAEEIKKMEDEFRAVQIQARKDLMIQGAGVMIGTVGGTALGGGNRGAQMGSSIGSTAGMLGSAAIGAKYGIGGGPVGMAIGAAIGGIVGGLLGSRKDKDARNDPAIRGLDAIERAQRETITAIAAQTDALLNPANRLINLPASFLMPGYAPSLGPNSVGGGGLSIERVEINVQGTNASVGDIQGAVETAMGNILASQRRGRAR